MRTQANSGFKRKVRQRRHSSRIRLRHLPLSQFPGLRKGILEMEKRVLCRPSVLVVMMLGLGAIGLAYHQIQNPSSKTWSLRE